MRYTLLYLFTGLLCLMVLCALVGIGHLVYPLSPVRASLYLLTVTLSVFGFEYFQNIRLNCKRLGAHVSVSEEDYRPYVRVAD